MKPITNLSDATEESETRIAAHDRTLLLSPLCFIQFCLRKYAIRTTAKKEKWSTPNFRLFLFQLQINKQTPNKENKNILLHTLFLALALSFHNEQQQSNNSNNITCRFSEIVFENSRLTSKEFISSTITLQDFKQQVKRSEQALQTSQETAAQRERSRSPLGGEMRGAVMEQLREDINCFTMVLCGAIIIINNVCLVDFCKLDGYTLKMAKLQVW